MFIAPPATEQDFGFYNNYIQKAGKDDLLTLLQQNLQHLQEMVASLTEAQLQFRYAPDKWSIKEILVHLIDSERTFNYRIMRASRDDKGVIPAINITEFVLRSHAAERTTDSIMEELELLRKATIVMFRNMHPSMLELSAPARDTMVTVRGYGYAMAGHIVHHLEIIKERYLPALAGRQTVA